MEVMKRVVRESRTEKKLVSNSFTITRYNYPTMMIDIPDNTDK